MKRRGCISWRNIAIVVFQIRRPPALFQPWRIKNYCLSSKQKTSWENQGEGKKGEGGQKEVTWESFSPLFIISFLTKLDLCLLGRNITKLSLHHNGLSVAPFPLASMEYVVRKQRGVLSLSWSTPIIPSKAPTCMENGFWLHFVSLNLLPLTPNSLRWFECLHQRKYLLSPSAIFPRIQSGASRPAHLLVKSTLPPPLSSPTE